MLTISCSGAGSHYCDIPPTCMVIQGIHSLHFGMRGLKGKNAIKLLLEKLVEGGTHIQDSDLGLSNLTAQILGQSAQHGSASKKKADTPRYYLFLKAWIKKASCPFQDYGNPWMVGFQGSLSPWLY